MPQNRTVNPQIAYRSACGAMYLARVEDFLSSRVADRLTGRVQLLFTSPPFPLNRKKRYGNLTGDNFIDWLAGLAEPFKRLLTTDGSIVLEMGNAWEPGEPAMSVLALKALLAFLERANLVLCQQFVCYNPARLPSPAQWVNVDRIRVKDSYTHVWWMSSSSRPKADNRRVLKPYSESMLQLLKSGKYNAGTRPSEHSIGKRSFLKTHPGAIPSNVLDPENLLTFSNTANNDAYLAHCRDHKLPIHPARMPGGLAEFFIKFLSEERDLIFDPFSGSNTTGACAERLNRRWIAVEQSRDYVAGSLARFKSNARVETAGLSRR